MNLKLWGGLLVGAMLFVGGYRYAAALYGADIAALREDYANRARELEETYRAKEQESARAIVAAWEERDRARRDAVRLDGDLDRLRDEAAALRRELSRTPADPCAPCRACLSECSKLLERGSELLERGAREYQGVAADKDALSSIR